MLGNIRDHRTDPTNPRVAAVFQGGRDIISADPLSPGCLYSAGVALDGTVGLYRVEVSTSVGTGKLKLAGGVSGPRKESLNRVSAIS